MALVIPIDECLSDSPTFRRLLSQSEGNLEDLEARLEKTLKLSNAVGESGRAHVTQQTQFLASLWELSSYFGLEQGQARGQGGHGNAGSALTHINRMIQVRPQVRECARGEGGFRRTTGDSCTCFDQAPARFPLLDLKYPFYLRTIRDRRPCDHAFGN